jgi:Zn-dependent peptidase ImmA (M78 family)
VIKMDKFDPTAIPSPQVDAIRSFIISKEGEIHAAIGPNEVLRDDIFPLLDHYCTVIYYPLPNEDNNGFHIDYPNRHFVYINTAQHKEKQIFTAAHELGHFWNVEQVIRQVDGYPLNTPHWDERIISRFAAELLMPEKFFYPHAERMIRETRKPEKSMSAGAMIRIITALMNEYFTSYKSVVYRLYELELIKSGAAVILWGEDPRLPRDTIEECSRTVALEQGYSRLYKTDNLCKINGLKDDLDKAKERQSVPESLLANFYAYFKISPDDKDRKLEASLPETMCEEGEQDATNVCD